MSDSAEHKRLKNRIRVLLNQRGDCVIWNNESGVAVRTRQDGSKFEVRHTHQRYGVGKGGADLIGLVAMAGKELGHTYGRFIALEIKTGEARTTKQQDLYIRLVRRYGGYATVVRSTEEAEQAILDCREGGYGDRFYP